METAQHGVAALEIQMGGFYVDNWMGNLWEDEWWASGKLERQLLRAICVYNTPTAKFWRPSAIGILLSIYLVHFRSLLLVVSIVISIEAN